MACDRGHTHSIVFVHACGYYSRAATNWGAASIRMNTVYVTVYEKTRHMGFFVKTEFDVWLISSTIELPHVRFRPIVHFVVEIKRFVCDRATPPIIEKLRSKGVAMYTYGVSAYYA